MQERSNQFYELTEKVIQQLQEHNYLESTVTNYRRFYKRVEKFMSGKGIAKYTHYVGETFLEELHSRKKYSYTSLNAHLCAIRRLNDLLEGNPYRCHHGNEHEIVDSRYVDLLKGFIEECRNKGNSNDTVYAKQRWCTTFLNQLEPHGCTDISMLSTTIVTKVCLCFKNKDAYPVIRMFLRFLYSESLTSIDFSGIVPKAKKPNVIPTIYLIKEIQALESSIDISTITGQRNIAILLLATRIGLRSGDIAKLRYDEIDLHSGEINLIQEKTKIPLSVRMPDKLKNALTTHIKHKRYDDGYVFHSLSAPYSRITTNIIRHIVNDHLNMAGIDHAEKKHGPHALRSSLATSMVNDDIPYETIRKILGHTDPDAIKHYAKVDIKHLREYAIAAPAADGSFLDFLYGRRSV